MNGILALRKEHVRIEELLIELEEVLDEKRLNLEYLESAFEELVSVLVSHELREEPFFKEISKFNNDMRDSMEEIEKIHSLIKGHLEVLKRAIGSGKENVIRIALENDGRMLFSKLRAHMHLEEKIFDSVIFLDSRKVSSR